MISVPCYLVYGGQEGQILFEPLCGFDGNLKNGGDAVPIPNQIVIFAVEADLPLESTWSSVCLAPKLI